MNRQIDVVIPVYKPDARFRKLLQMLMIQSVQPRQILLINTEKELLDIHLLEGLEEENEQSAGAAGPVIRLEHIRKMDFDHGGTRHRAAGMLQREMILFMTQDAVPKDNRLIERLLEPFENTQVCASYACQLPQKDCGLLERYSRSFNYPLQSRIKTAKDLPELGIKTYFCSNVCAV
ncbi:MAG: glycosyltransferase family 2 protein, partial [Lachnospiraceae bacterium]|nr:glycosyltransferase family 2 protein [Lachnospiraceae bacterium]